MKVTILSYRMPKDANVHFDETGVMKQGTLKAINSAKALQIGKTIK